MAHQPKQAPLRRKVFRMLFEVISNLLNAMGQQCYLGFGTASILGIMLGTLTSYQLCLDLRIPVHRTKVGNFSLWTA